MKQFAYYFFISVFLLKFYDLSAQDTIASENKRITIRSSTQPVQLSFSLLGHVKHIGFTAGASKYLSQKEIHRTRRNGKEKLLEKNRLFDLSFGYYYQRGLHQRYMLLAGYHMQRVKRNGFYTSFMPQLGLSRSFLTEEAYRVNDNGEVEKVNGAGKWNLAAAMNLGIGKKIKKAGNGHFQLHDLFARSNLWVFYPNFRSVALKPSLQLGASFTLTSRQSNFQKKIIFK